MKIKIKKPRDFINPLLSRKSIEQAEIQAFENALDEYLKSMAAQTASKQTEPNIVTNTLKPFLDSIGHISQAHSQIGQSGIDLTITRDGRPAVIIEAKLPDSREMITSEDLNKKAFHEAVLYFMRERKRGNDCLFHVIVTDFYNWFVFDAKDFEANFWKNSPIKQLFETHSNPSLLGDTTSEFYSALEAELPKQKSDGLAPKEIECAHLNLKLKRSEKELVALYKLLSADCLLKNFNPNDANSLNGHFYNELLYILGLEESKDGGKKVIRKAQSGQTGALYENIENKLKQYDRASDFESVIKLIIIWINRILFLKLLESQIVRWNKSVEYKFLNPSKVRKYDQLETLFFDVLAKPVDQRTSHDYDRIPYLNSSLFQIHDDEKAGITISNLSEDLEIEYFSKTVVKDERSQRKTGNAHALPYLLEFLDAYDFANDSGDEVVASTKSLISASVLGLIFEKINGYKDGSFYTPGFVTSYMAKEALESAVVEKFNAANGWDCATLKDVYNKEPNISDANQIVNSTKICDPAVGSGHFLVSCLNELIRIKSELGILVDEDGKRLKNYVISIENDELLVKDDEGEIFEYERGSLEKSRVQKTLFLEKQALIENCLFGVDINPNSVNICRLRLWIELLKNAYYKKDGALDTLPNIDINIHCGDSLVKRFDLSDELTGKSIQREVAEYKQRVREYKENIGSKHSVMDAIVTIKEKFRVALQDGHVARRQLRDRLSRYVRDFGYEELDKDFKLLAVEWNLFGKQHDMFGDGADRNDLKRHISELEKSRALLEEIEHGKIYENAFEWRFEFPEVLNEHGDFNGFDVVIANPPYIDSEKMIQDGHEALREYLHQKYSCAEGNWDIYIVFMELAMKLLKDTGVMSFITPDKWLSKPFGHEFRRQFIDGIQRVTSLGRGVFDSALIDSIITQASRRATSTVTAVSFDEGRVEILNSVVKAELVEPYALDPLLSQHYRFIDRLEKGTERRLGNLALCESACATSDAYKLKPFVVECDSEFNAQTHYLVANTGTLGKYVSRWGTKPMTYLKSKYLRPVVDRGLFAKNFTNTYKTKSDAKKIVVKGLTLLDATLDLRGEMIPGKTTLVLMSDNEDTLKYACALLNCPLSIFFIKAKYGSASYNGGISFTKEMLNSIPIPNHSGSEKIVELVDKVVELKSQDLNADTLNLEKQINACLYENYGLSGDEVAMVEGVAHHQ